MSLILYYHIHIDTTYKGTSYILSFIIYKNYGTYIYKYILINFNPPIANLILYIH